MGSGFKLAMRDMEIRGAGNLLGREQHGFMHLVSHEMYLNLLEKAVRSLRGERGKSRAYPHCSGNTLRRVSAGILR